MRLSGTKLQYMDTVTPVLVCGLVGFPIDEDTDFSTEICSWRDSTSLRMLNKLVAKHKIIC